MNTVQKNYLFLSVCLSASPSVCQLFRLSVSLSVRLSSSSSVFSASMPAVSLSIGLSTYLYISQFFLYLSPSPSVRQHYRLLSVSPPVCQPICLSALHLTVNLSSVCLSVCTVRLPVCLFSKQLCLGWRGNQCTVPDSLTNDWCEPNFLSLDKPSFTPYAQKNPFFLLGHIPMKEFRRAECFTLLLFILY